MLAALFLMLASPPPAAAARLVYVRNAGAETCPDERAVRAAVGARLGYDPFLTDAPSTLFAEVSRRPGGFLARIRFIDANNAVKGMREIEHLGERCSDIVDAMALSMSLAIDPDSLDRPAAPAAAPATSSPPTDAPPEPPPPAISALPMASPPVIAPTAATSEHPLSLSLGFAPTVWVGAAPAVSAGALGFVRGRVDHLSAALEARIDLPASRTLAEGTVETSLFYGSLVPCWHAGAFAACAVGSLGSIRGTSRDVTNPREDSSLHAGVGLRARGELHFANAASAFAAIEGLYTLTPQRLLLNGAAVYEVPRFGGGLTLGLVVDVF